MNKSLYQERNALKFYEQRYQSGYMDSWPLEKKQRIFEVIQSLNLPEIGNALDFGCGNGIFTDIIQQALPKWTVYGCDISQNAIENAKKLYPKCNFFVSENKNNLEFDFLFSHHVLEHVYDLKKILEIINDFLKPNSFILHILPCGNEGSFEHKICSLRKDGINAQMENRFFFEDEGHLRRLSSEQMNDLLKVHNFKIEKEFYDNQYYGALRWISRSLPQFIFNITNTKQAKNQQAERLLQKYRIILLFICAAQLPVLLWKHIWNLPNKKFHHYFICLLNVVPAIISYPFFKVMDIKAQQEWNDAKSLPNGSEMYLFYKRVI